MDPDIPTFIFAKLSSSQAEFGLILQKFKMNAQPQGHFKTFNILQTFSYTFWCCVSKISKEFRMFLKVGWNFDAQIFKICKIHLKWRIKQTSVLFWNISAMKARIFMKFNGVW